MPWLYFSNPRVLSIKTFSGPDLVIFSLYTSVAEPKLFILDHQKYFSIEILIEIFLHPSIL